MTKRYSILIAEDHALVRAGICSLLMRESDLNIVGEVETGEDAVRAACALLPDVLLLDLNMPGCGGLQAISEIKKLAPSVKSIVITMHKTDEYIHEALRSGAVGYILKESGPEELILAIRKVLSGKIYLSPDVSERFISTLITEKQKPVDPVPLETLTSRELQVVKLVAQGLGNKQIADRLQLSIKTVEKHRSTLMRKLGIHNRVMLVAYAISQGIVTM